MSWVHKPTPVHELRPPLQVEIEGDNEPKSQSEQEQNRRVVVLDDPDFVAKLMNEHCSACEPHPSYYEDGTVQIPSSSHHMPWDEIELRKHDLVNSKCEHFAAVPPLDELRIRRVKTPVSGLFQPHSPANSKGLPDRKGKITFALDEESSTESSVSDHSYEWEKIEASPAYQMFTDIQELTEGNLHVTRLMDGRRMILVKGDNGCELRVLENMLGERLLVSMRCCGQHGNNAPAQLEEPESPKAVEQKEASAGVGVSMTSSGATESNQAPPFALTTQPTQMSEPEQLAPPTWSSDARVPMAFESVVAESDGGATDSAARIPESVQSDSPQNVSVKLRKRRKSRRTTKSGKEADVKPNVRVEVNVDVDIRPKRKRSGDRKR